MKRKKLLRIAKKMARDGRKKAGSRRSASFIRGELLGAMEEDDTSRSLVQRLSEVNVTGRYHGVQWFLHVQALEARRRVAEVLDLARLLESALPRAGKRGEVSVRQKPLQLRFAASAELCGIAVSYLDFLNGPFDEACRGCGGLMEERARIGGGAIRFFVCTNSRCLLLGVPHQVIYCD